MIRTHQVKDTTSFMLAKVCKAHRGYVGELLAEHRLHPGQEMVLIELFEKDGLRGGELAERLRVEPPTVTKMLRRLERCGLVERRPDPRDARSFRVYLTNEGRSLEAPISRIWDDVERRALAGMSVGERRNLHRLLAKVRASVDPNFVAQ